tara:strand:- start:336 stop:554 length:219 start_codon:yes stop_codon:yes gene_type:complete
MKTETKFYPIDCELVKKEQANFKKFKQEQKTIFYNNQPFEEVLIQAVIFAVSFVFIATFLVAVITLIYNLLS